MAILHFFRMIRDAGKAWSADRITLHGAAIAYYTVFSLAPLLILAVAIASLVYDEQEARKGVTQEIHRTIGPLTAEAVENLLANTDRAGSKTGVTALGLATLLFGASGVFLQLQQALNQIWKVDPGARHGLLWTLIHRAISFLLVLGTGLILLLSLIINSLLAGLHAYVQDDILPGGVSFWQGVHLAVSFLSFALLFAMVYKLLPDTHVSWGEVWFGAFVTAFLFLVGEYGIGLYLGRSTVASTFGAAGSLAVVLLWVYYSAQIVLFGAEFTHVFAQRRRAQAGT